VQKEPQFQTTAGRKADPKAGQCRKTVPMKVARCQRRAVQRADRKAAQFLMTVVRTAGRLRTMVQQTVLRFPTRVVLKALQFQLTAERC